MDDSQYYQDPPLQILKLMKQTFGDENTYYLGSPTYELPEADYPAIIVQSVQSANTTKGAPTGKDVVREIIHLHFFELSKDDVNTPNDQDNTLRRLYKKIQGRDPLTGQYAAGTAMYALRTNLSLQSGNTGFPTTIDHDIDVLYDIIPRADRPSVLQAIVTIATDERVFVLNRV